MAYEHLKYPRMKCTDVEGELKQKEREATYKEFTAKKWGGIYHELTCIKCGKTFYGINPTGKYCSYRCRNDAQIEARRQRHINKRKKHCTMCGEFFNAKREDTVFCSPACKQKFYREHKKHSVTDLGFDKLQVTENSNDVMVIGLANVSETQNSNKQVI